ncbi:MAG: B12-binding domain-containing radical SAM protein [Alphaproteobacteria bacterium]|nr:B12-binding domain-containing radical SAM protein [Alphaproteobacteria bacterium]
MLARGDLAGRLVLCVFPRYTPSFGTFEFSYPLAGISAFMPPQGLLVIAAAVPPSWPVRFIDENLAPATDEDFTWAEVVFVSGMHVQRRQMEDIRRRAHARGRVVVLGGSSVSACPENYPDFDYLHVGELGDATDDLFARLADDVTRPEKQVVLTTKLRRELSEFPIPAYELAQIDRYLLGSIQFSSGCPYTCEFCDIPALYGRVARYKTPEQICAELDKLIACGLNTSVYFVDDNFIANKRAVREMLPHLIDWQKRNNYPLLLSCEATLNIAKRPEILELMREAYFTTIFCGIETPDPAALKAISKDHNMMVPMLGAIETLNGFGMEVVSGIIMGLDTDTPETGDAILEFVEQSHIPMLTMNLLQALPRTPLWDRLKREERLVDEEGRESNVAFRMPYDQVLAMWRQCIETAYAPDKLLARYERQIRDTYSKRLRPDNQMQRATWSNIKRGVAILARIFWHIGIKGHYKRTFWRFAWTRFRRGEIEHFISTMFLAHHLIQFTREATAGRRSASNYSVKRSESLVPAE